MSLRACLLGMAFVGLHLSATAEAVPFVVNYEDPAGQGFLHPALGESRRAAFDFAVSRWGNILAGSVPVTISASMPHAGGSGTGALLASAGSVTIHRNFGGVPDTWYAAALANQIAGTDLNGPENAEIQILFNVDIDEPDVLGSVSWHYGTDAQAGFDIDLVTVALHEIGHGLGFFELVNTSGGGWTTPSNQPGVFDRMLFRPQVGRFTEMRNGERLAAVISPLLLWDGPAVSLFNGSAPSMFTPEPLVPGSSVAHWDPVLSPGELMAPSSEGAMHDPGLLLPALVDMGWELAVASPTPRMVSATPTLTPTPTVTSPQLPAETPPPRRDVVYVANFDDDTVSVFDTVTVSTIGVGDGPIGIAAASDGRRVYVTNFRDGSLSVISTRRGAVIATVPIGASANGVAVTSDGRAVVVADPFLDEAIVIDAAALQVRSRIAAGAAPSAVAVGPQDFVFVAAYGEPLITVIDVDSGLRRAIVRARHPNGQPNVVDIAFAAEAGRGYAIYGFDPNWATVIDGNVLTSGLASLQMPASPQAVALRRDGDEVYVAGHSNDATRHEVKIFDERLVQVASVSTAAMPDSMALSTDGSRLYVTNTGANLLSIIDPSRRVSRGTVPVGAAPMGVGVAAVPEICDGDCNGDLQVMVDELIRIVNIATGEMPITFCTAADHDDDSRVTVDEIVLATSRALGGCGN